MKLGVGAREAMERERERERKAKDKERKDDEAALSFRRKKGPDGVIL